MMYVARITEDSTGKVHWESVPTSERHAQRMADGAGINLNWDEFTVGVYEVDA